ncbi:CocE/NonD family hydrolase [Roseibium sp. MMSF_3544]|uniref:CocE/NonD family hydrolase n=1 Tax=unclassified Roseibium TaxID=2629323 RepID=UPI00273F1421|nr:CocE/NonD family hydrolase [Roseibium sp. MMSF_3544]
MNKHFTGIHRVHETEHVWIPMPDGTRLAARLWLPAGAHEQPVPAIVEYIPYRKHDMVRARDERNHPYFAEHGYACLRVDMRGSGDSEGDMPDMYCENELADARDMINWIAGQSWCNGRVGMFGTSWGGTASLQASIDAPAALKAVVAVCATHDRYEDDIHHKGGCLLTDTFEWGATLPAILASPPSDHVGPDWMARWKSRLETLTFPVENWVREEARGTFWRHGSVKYQTDRLSCPVLAVGGWSDRYSNSVMSLVDARPDLVWGIVGPWGHHYPDQAHPGPGIGFQSLALEWWDQCLRHETVPDWPRLRVWLREFEEPADVIDTRKGHWIESGPARSETTLKRLSLSSGGLSHSPSSETFDVEPDLGVGQASGDTGYFGRFGGLPLDQSEDDARCLALDTPTLDEDLILFGSAEVTLTVSAEFDRSQLCLRLCDVAPDGRSNRVALAVRNLALDDELDEPDTSFGSAPREIRIRFHTKAYRFAKGHRIRLAIGTSYWPLVWTPPEQGSVRILEGFLDMPCSAGKATTLKTDMPLPEDLPAQKSHEVLAAPKLSRYGYDDESGGLSSGWHQGETAVRHDAINTTFAYETTGDMHLHPHDPLSAKCDFRHRMRFERPDGTAHIDSTLKARCTGDTYSLDGVLVVRWNGSVLHEATWKRSIPRKLS